MNSYFDTIKRIKEFNDERDWNKFHTPKNVAISISLEANELLEFFQWDDNEVVIGKLKDEKYAEEMKDEIGDIGNYLMVMCDQLGIDLLDAINDKLDKNKAKYPVEKCKGRSNKYTFYQE